MINMNFVLFCWGKSLSTQIRIMLLKGTLVPRFTIRNSDYLANDKKISPTGNGLKTEKLEAGDLSIAEQMAPSKTAP